ncbi:MAG TPA: hypothetical protein VHZ03_19655 [Trebonia sp.]|nr:hypothetical protein [Trebonia sp.]
MIEAAPSLYSGRLIGEKSAGLGAPAWQEASLPQTQALHYVREMLVISGVLPARNEYLERLAPWLEHLLHDKPAHHARLISRPRPAVLAGSARPGPARSHPGGSRRVAD